MTSIAKRFSFARHTSSRDVFLEFWLFIVLENPYSGKWAFLIGITSLWDSFWKESHQLHWFFGRVKVNQALTCRLIAEIKFHPWSFITCLKGGFDGYPIREYRHSPTASIGLFRLRFITSSHILILWVLQTKKEERKKEKEKKREVKNKNKNKINTTGHFEFYKIWFQCSFWSVRPVGPQSRFWEG